MPRLEVPRVVVILAMLLLLAAPAAAQTTSTIEGTVTDTSGAVIPGAEVTARASALPPNEARPPMRRARIA
jgi:hypothetical protein